ncbi:DUF3822 family protein [Ferruginibacter sp.]
MPAENQQVNPSFNIKAAGNATVKPILLVQAGRQGVSFIQLDTETNTFIGVQVYHFAKNLSDVDIAIMINDIIAAENLSAQNFKKIFVTWCFNESIIVPHEYFSTGTAKQMIELVYGDASQAVVQNEIVLTQDLHTIYRVPVAVKNVFSSFFPFSIQNHQDSLLINLGRGNRNMLYCNFYPSSFTLLLRKNGQLQVIKNFDFNTPDDVVYHLLNTCRAFGTDVAQISLTVSGMINAGSGLHNELYKYFVEIDFAELPGNFNYTAAIKDEPAHYFSHLFTTALCVL